MEDKIIYQGEFQQGVRHGQGKHYLPEGGFCEGQFLDGFITQGTKTYPNGDVYEGKFENNMPHGQAKFTTIDSIVFEECAGFIIIP